MELSDVERVRALIDRWYEKRRWAERLLLQGLRARSLDEVLQRAVGKCVSIDGSPWIVNGHGTSLHVYFDRERQLGGIDFDVGRAQPSAEELRFFAEAQIEEGALEAASARPLLIDRDRWNRLARVALGLADQAFARAASY